MKRLLLFMLTMMVLTTASLAHADYGDCWDVSSNGEVSDYNELIIWISYNPTFCDGALLTDTIQYIAYQKVYYPLTGQTIVSELTQYLEYEMIIPHPDGQEDGSWIGVMKIDVTNEFVAGHYWYNVTAQAYDDIGSGFVNLLSDETGWMEGTNPVQVRPVFDNRPGGFKN